MSLAPFFVYILTVTEGLMSYRTRIQFAYGYCLLLLAGFLFLAMPPTLQAQDLSTRVLTTLQHDGEPIEAYVDQRSGMATWIRSVDALDFTPGGPRSFTTEAGVVAAADAFLAAHAGLLGISPDRIVLERVESRRNLWFLGYGQRHQGVPVVNAEVGVTITRDGRLVAAGARAFPDVAVGTTPVLGAGGRCRRHSSTSGLRA
jgi:hypothetical protein